jgi:hypothetical protein
MFVSKATKFVAIIPNENMRYGDICILIKAGQNIA